MTTITSTFSMKDHAHKPFPQRRLQLHKFNGLWAESARIDAPEKPTHCSARKLEQLVAHNAAVIATCAAAADTLILLPDTTPPIYPYRLLHLQASELMVHPQCKT